MSGQLPKRLLSFVSSAILATALASCELATDAGVAASASPAIQITAASAQETMTVLEPPFPLPDFGKLVECNSRYYAYTNVFKEDLKGYIDQLTSEGYRAIHDADASYFAKDRIFLNVDWEEYGAIWDVTIYFIDGSLDPHPGAVSCDEAKTIIGDNAIKTVLECPIPELYQKTGAQLFYVGYQDKDEDEENLEPDRYLILGKKAFLLDTFSDEFMVYDIDADGAYELFYFMPGFTSGVFTYGIGAVSFEGGTITEKYACMYEPCEYRGIAFQRDAETGLSLLEYTVWLGNVRSVMGTRKISVVNNVLAIE